MMSEGNNKRSNNNSSFLTTSGKEVRKKSRFRQPITEASVIGLYLNWPICFSFAPPPVAVTGY